MAKKNAKKKPGAGAGRTEFKPFGTGSKPGAGKDSGTLHFLPGGRKGRPLCVLYPSGTANDLRGEYLGVDAQEPGLHNPEGKAAPSIRLTEPFYSDARKVGLDPGAYADNAAAVQTLNDAQAAGGQVLLQAGRVFNMPPTVVIIDRSARDGYDAVLYAPPPGCVPSNPLWPGVCADFPEVPKPLPFVTDWIEQNRSYRFFTPEGQTGFISGRFGFQLVAPSAEVGTVGVRRGVIPGRPSIRTADDPTQKPAANVTPLSFGSVVVCVDDNTVVYYPPQAKPGDEWPASVLRSPFFPTGATFAGTEYLVSENPNGPPLDGLIPGNGFAGYGGEDTGGGFSLVGSAGKAELDFPDAEALRASFVRLFQNNPNTAGRYTALRVNGEWTPAPDLLNSYAMTKPDIHAALYAIFSAVAPALAEADIVLWDNDLAEEAVGPEDPEKPESRVIMDAWQGKPFPSRLLRDLTRAQFHVMREGNYALRTPEQLKAWGLDRPCLVSGFLLLPFTVADSSDEEDERPMAWAARTERPGDKPGVYPVFFFVPEPPGGYTPGEEWEARNLTAAEAFFRARALYPLTCDDPEATIYHAFAQVAALLDFMTSPRILVSPTRYEPDPNAQEKPKREAKRRPQDPNAPRYLTLRRVEVAAETLEADGATPTERGELTESVYRKKHYRTVRFGPGLCYSERREIPRSRVRKDLPLKEGAEAEVEARESANPPRRIRVVL